MKELYQTPPGWMNHRVFQRLFTARYHELPLTENGSTARIKSLIILLLAFIFSTLATQAQQASSNAISLENAKPGTRYWITNESPNHTIEGFAADLSYNRGQKAQFKIKTSAHAYKIRIFRLGYYGGLGGCNKASIVVQGPTPTAPASPQPTCLTGPDGLVDCGNWDVSAEWNIPSDAVSGVYSAKLIRLDDTTQTNQIIFVVRDDFGQSDLLFQTSDATWQAYNTYSQNLYSGAHKVSYNRPLFVTKTPNQILGAEYPMLRWLERNGFDISYTTNVDTKRRGQLLLPSVGHHKVFLSVGHDEYWSQEMRDNVTAARNAGLNLAFFSGNEVYWKTRYEPSITSPAVDDRTLVCFKENECTRAQTGSCSNWTGEWHKCLPENELSGQMDCIVVLENYNQSLSVPASFQHLRFWRHTSLANTGQPLLVPDILGYEWDPESKEFQGHYPKGRIRLSETVINGRVHHTSLYKHSSGAWVFGAGTIGWSAGLDNSSSGLGLPPNPDIQQATLNLLLDMGVDAPATLVPGLTVSTVSDAVAPTVAIGLPAPGTSLPQGTPAVISGTAADNRVVGGVEVSTDNGATWRAATGTSSWQFTWMPAAPGAVTIQVRSFDDSGNWSPVSSLTVTVGRPGATTVFYSQDGPDALSIPYSNSGPALLGMKFRASVPGQITGVRFFKVKGDTGQHEGLLYDAANPTKALASVTFTGETTSGWQSATFSSAVTISANKTYVVAFFSPLGYYATTGPAFAQAVVNGPLRGLADGEDGGNGVRADVLSQNVNSPKTLPMPTGTGDCGTNYWVDAEFVPTPAKTLFSPTDVPSASANDGPANAVQLGMKFRSSVAGQVTGVRFYKVAGDAGTHVGQLYDAAGALLSTVTFAGETASGWQEAIFAQPVTIQPNTTYTISYHSSAGVCSYTRPGFAQAIINGPLRGLADGEDGGNGVYAYSSTPTFPFAAYQATNYWVDPVFVPAPVQTLFSSADVPNGSGDGGPANAGQLGMKFRSSVAGQVTGVRFYKVAGDAGTHVGQLHDAAGALLSTVTFAGETASGWQEAIFAQPVTIQPNTTYTISYHSSAGVYAYTLGGLTQAVVNGPLRGLADGEDGGNGVYAYSSTPTFPYLSSQASNYWVDLMFMPASGARPALSSARNTAKPTGLYLKLSPNPASEYIQATFGSPTAAPASLTIYDTRGVVVRKIPVGNLRPGVNKQLRIETSSLPSGLYMFKFSNNVETTYSKVLVAH